jgi:hypothetical protein
MHTNLLEVLANAIMSRDAQDDIIDAIRSADAKARATKSDVYVMADLSCCLPGEAIGKPLEIIRYISDDVSDE